MTTNEKDTVFQLQAIGTVKCGNISESELRFGQDAVIEIKTEYLPALKRIEEHDFYWVLCWLDRASRCLLETHSWHLKDSDEPYGVFALRSPCRPNPVSLTLVYLKKVKENKLFVSGLDVFNDTPVIDIKPYKKCESIFSPKAPYIRPQQEKFIYKSIYEKALNHHREKCRFLLIAVRMAFIAEGVFNDLTDDELKVFITGDACLADALQGITGARLASPRRFYYTESKRLNSCVWQKNGKELTVKLKPDISNYTLNQLENMRADQIFEIVLN